MDDTPRIAIVGAGLAGLITARTLRADGVATQLFEKSRAPGGRAATRRAGEYRFDHGAQYFTQRDLRTSGLLDEWLAAGVVAPWAPRLAARDDGQWRTLEAKETRYVGVPGMRALGEHLAASEQVRYDTTVATITRRDACWALRSTADESLGEFDQVLVCVPAAQARALLENHEPSFARALAGTDMRPCIAAMVTLAEEPERATSTEWDAAFVNDSPVLAWVAREASKPGRAPHQSLVLHATAEWSAEQLEQEPASLLPPMLDALWDVLGGTVPVVHAVAHRWRYAIPAPEDAHATREAVRVPALHDAELGLGAAGDWCAGGRVEGALLSGLALAQRLL